MTMTLMPEAYAAKEALLDDLCRPLLLELTANGHASPVVLSNGFQFDDLPDAPGFQLARLMAAPGHSATLLKGDIGAHSPVFAAPQAVRFEMLCGRLRWWQQSRGDQADNDAYQVLTRGDVVYLAPGEPHTYRALMPTLAYSILNPAMPEHDLH